MLKSVKLKTLRKTFVSKYILLLSVYHRQEMENNNGTAEVGFRKRNNGERTPHTPGCGRRGRATMTGRRRLGLGKETMGNGRLTRRETAEGEDGSHAVLNPVSKCRSL